MTINSRNEIEIKKVIKTIEAFKIISLSVLVFWVFLFVFFKEYSLEYVLKTKGGPVFALAIIVLALSWIISTYSVTKILKLYKKTTLDPIWATVFIIAGAIGQIPIVIYLWIKANALTKEISQEKRYVVTYWAVCIFIASAIILYFRPGNIGQESEEARKIREAREYILEDVYTNAGKEISIALDSNQPAGYKWQLVPLHTKMIEFVSEKYIPDETDPQGGGGKQIWTFRAHDMIGGTTVHFEYINSSGKNIRPIKKKNIRINIR
jgi:predicted secreted protein